ncbi:MAG: RNase adapter RapZ [Myxococcota bacterium]
MIITGLSGSGKSTAIHALEDLGYFCIDNLPVQLLPKVVELATGGGTMQSLAFVIDTRLREFLDKAGEMVDQLETEGVPLDVVFLEADEDELVKRYSETRRRHPMTPEDGTVRDGIKAEKKRLADLRHRADEIIDTTNQTVHDLKALIQAHFGGDGRPELQITVLSFGFKHGLPVECDLVYDVRFLPNPYFVSELRDKTGADPDVADYVLGFPETSRFIALFQEMADFVLPLYRREGKSYLTIGIGCTGGRHRSIAISETIAERLEGRGWDVQVRHRDTVIGTD